MELVTSSTPYELSDDSVKDSLKVESPQTSSFLSSRFISFLDELSSKVYFWVDANIIERGGYDINRNNGWLINALSHGAFRLRKVVPAAKELEEAKLLNVTSLGRMLCQYTTSFLDRQRIQPFTDESGNNWWAYNLNLPHASLEDSAQAMATARSRINIVLGNCSKGHTAEELKTSTEAYVCPYRVDKRCFYLQKHQRSDPANGSPFYSCAQEPCLVGYLHKTLGQSGDNVAFHTILGGVQTFREIPDFFNMNTDQGSAQFLIWATCGFSIPYLIQAARMFPNIKGLAIAYENGCRTLCDRIIRLRGERRDRHITRFAGSLPLGENPISKFMDEYQKIRQSGF